MSTERIVEQVNTRTWIIPRGGGPGTSFNTESFFLAGGGCDGASDPRIMYDDYWKRWFMVATEISSPGRWCLAVSKTNLPEGAWWFYAFQPPDAPFFQANNYQPVFPDYPGMGSNIWTIVLTGNLAQGFFGLATVDQSAVLVLNKADLMNGLSVHSQYFPPDFDKDHLFLLQPSNHYDAGTFDTYLAGVNVMASAGTTLRLQKIDGIPGVGALPSMVQTNLSVPANSPFRSPPPSNQKGTTTDVESNDQRVLAVIYRDSQLWVALHQGCIIANDNDGNGNPIERVCVRYMSIDPFFVTHPILQDMKIKDKKTYYYFPSITLDSQGNLLTAFNKSSNSEYVSVYASGRKKTDPAETMREPVLLRPGLVSYTDSRFRWGDYNGAAPEVNGGVGAWFAVEIPVAADVWGTWISSIHLGDYPQ